MVGRLGARLAVAAADGQDDPAMDQVPSTDGVTIALHDLGGDGPTLVLVHATGFCGRIWEPVAAELAGFRSWAPDLRAHGSSERPSSAPLDWWAIATDVQAVFSHLRPRPAIAVGHSMGAACLLLAELAAPGTFERLWLYDPVTKPSLGVGETERFLAEGARRRRDTFPSAQAAFENFAAKPPLSSVTDAARWAYVHHGFERLADGTVRLRCRPEDEALIYELGAVHGAFERLEEITCPVTIAHGRFEEGRPSQYAPEVTRRLAHGSEIVFPELSHFGPLEDPGRVAASIRETFAG